MTIDIITVVPDLLESPFSHKVGRPTKKDLRDLRDFME